MPIPFRPTLCSSLLVVALASVAKQAAACGGHEQPTRDGACERREEEFDPAAEGMALRFDLLRTAPALRDAFSAHGGELGVATSVHGRAGKHVALEFGLDFSTGKGVGGIDRYELGIRYPEILVYVNPTSRTQLFVLSGLTTQIVAFGQGDATYKLPASQTVFAFMGGVLGVGIEEHVSKETAYTIELRGFARARLDGRDNDLASTNTEFHGATRIDTGVTVAVGMLAF